jgi:hypothetical protein
MERVRRLVRGDHREEEGSGTPGPPASPQAPPAPVRGAQVIYGASVQTLALAGRTIAQARPLVETILGVDRRSPALVNGRRVRDSYVIAEGDTVEYVHLAGEKGRHGRTDCDCR